MRQREEPRSGWRYEPLSSHGRVGAYDKEFRYGGAGGGFEEREREDRYNEAGAAEYKYEKVEPEYAARAQIEQNPDAHIESNTRHHAKDDEIPKSQLILPESVNDYNKGENKNDAEDPRSTEYKPQEVKPIIKQSVSSSETQYNPLNNKEISEHPVSQPKEVLNSRKTFYGIIPEKLHEGLKSEESLSKADTRSRSKSAGRKRAISGKRGARQGKGTLNRSVEKRPAFVLPKFDKHCWKCFGREMVLELSRRGILK